MSARRQRRARRKTVLISGAGLAGPALAWWLDRLGFEPSMVEIAPKFRSGGYMIDFWGKGFDIVEKMGLRPQVEGAGYHVQEVRFVDQDGSRVGGFSTAPFWHATDGRFTSVPRGELAHIIWKSLPEQNRNPLRRSNRSARTDKRRYRSSFREFRSHSVRFGSRRRRSALARTPAALRP